MEIAVGLALLSAFGFASGSILMRIATQYVSPPTATFFTVLVGAVMVSAVAFAVNFDEIKSLPLAAYGWIALMGVLAYRWLGYCRTRPSQWSGPQGPCP